MPTFLTFILALTLLSSASAQPQPFTDKDLNSIFKKNISEAVVYIWSPHMPLSVNGLNEALYYTKKNGIQLFVTLDNEANQKMAQEIALQNKWPDEYLRPNQSRRLIDRSSRVHYPSYHFISKDRFSRPPLPGYKLSAELDTFRKGVK